MLLDPIGKNKLFFLLLLNGRGEKQLPNDLRSFRHAQTLNVNKQLGGGLLFFFFAYDNWAMLLLLSGNF